MYCFDGGGDARRAAWRFLPIFLKRLYFVDDCNLDFRNTFAKYSIASISLKCLGLSTSRSVNAICNCGADCRVGWPTAATLYNCRPLDAKQRLLEYEVMGLKLCVLLIFYIGGWRDFKKLRPTVEVAWLVRFLPRDFSHKSHHVISLRACFPIPSLKLS